MCLLKSLDRFLVLLLHLLNLHKLPFAQQQPTKCYLFRFFMNIWLFRKKKPYILDPLTRELHFLSCIHGKSSRDIYPMLPLKGNSWFDEQLSHLQTRYNKISTTFNFESLIWVFHLVVYLERDNFVKVLRLYLPILFDCFRHFFILAIRYIQCCWIIVFILWCQFILIPNLQQIH